MPSATPTILHYANTIDVSLAANAVDLTSSALRGHRVQVPIDASILNSWFCWLRYPGSSRPIGSTSTGFPNLVENIQDALGTYGFNDVDGSAGGLDFSTASFPSGDLSRIHASSTPAPCMNDLVVAYILYKCYGKTAIDTTAVFNIEDTQDLLSDSLISNNIYNNLTTELGKSNTACAAAVNGSPIPSDSGAIDKMFRDLLSADPMRFFNADGTQMTGLYETTVDHNGSGTWRLAAGDIIEIDINIVFGAAVSSRGFVAGTTTMEAVSSGETIAINSGDAFSLRLQLVAQ